MAEILWEGYVPIWTTLPGGTRVSSGSSLHYIRTHGDSSEAIFADLNQQKKTLYAENEEFRAVGTHNRRADWTTVFGPADRLCRFADDPEEFDPLPQDDIH